MNPRKDLFTAIASHAPREGRTPRENFLTEGISFILGAVDGLAADYVRWLLSKCGDKPAHQSGPVTVHTQERTSEGKYVDQMLLEGKEVLIFVEHKLGSPLGGGTDSQGESLSQTEFYRREADRRSARCKRVVLVSDYFLEAPGTHARLLWSDVYTWLSDWLGSQESLEPVSRWLIEQMLSFLEGIGMKPIQIKPSHAEVIRSFSEFQKAIDALLEKVMSGLRENYKKYDLKRAKGDRGTLGLRPENGWYWYGTGNLIAPDRVWFRPAVCFGPGDEELEFVCMGADVWKQGLSRRAEKLIPEKWDKYGGCYTGYVNLPKGFFKATVAEQQAMAIAAMSSLVGPLIEA